MPLQSKAFKGDPKLENCLILDSAHVVPGASGDHVGKIQKAIIVLGAGVITAAEVARQFYGNSTAQTVLAYKTKRNIINKKYQQTPG